MSDLESALEELTSIQEEYTEWKDNLPENLASSALGEKLEEVTNLDISSIADNVRTAIEEAGSAIDEADGVDLPQGFGRD
jgi:predicted metal-binding transcription factor (methanogenesis marker protein 9)